MQRSVVGCMILCAGGECDQGSVSAVAGPAPGPGSTLGEREITHPASKRDCQENIRTLASSGLGREMCLTDTENTFAPRRHFSELKDSSATPYFSSRESLGDTNLKNNAQDELFVETFLSIEKNGKYEPDFVKMR